MAVLILGLVLDFNTCVGNILICFGKTTKTAGRTQHTFPIAYNYAPCFGAAIYNHNSDDNTMCHYRNPYSVTTTGFYIYYSDTFIISWICIGSCP